MLDAGFVEEVRRLMALPAMSAAVPAMRSVGYRQLWMYLSGTVGLDEATRQARVATRRLAKRQLTWLRSDPVDLVLDPLSDDVYDRSAVALAQAGVSRRAARCNIMEVPLECREHGV
jgi:tRNA dimethylallyltransferase